MFGEQEFFFLIFSDFFSWGEREKKRKRRFLAGETVDYSFFLFFFLCFDYFVLVRMKRRSKRRKIKVCYEFFVAPTSLPFIINNNMSRQKKNMKKKKDRPKQLNAIQIKTKNYQNFDFSCPFSSVFLTSKTNFSIFQQQKQTFLYLPNKNKGLFFYKSFSFFYSAFFFLVVPTENHFILFSYYFCFCFFWMYKTLNSKDIILNFV